jgi:hypothetical protein
MSRKDYIVIATAIASMPTHAPALRTAKRSAALTLANALANDNPRFNRAFFLAACGEEA